MCAAPKTALVREGGSRDQRPVAATSISCLVARWSGRLQPSCATAFTAGPNDCQDGCHHSRASGGWHRTSARRGRSQQRRPKKRLPGQPQAMQLWSDTTRTVNVFANNRSQKMQGRSRIGILRRQLRHEFASRTLNVRSLTPKNGAIGSARAPPANKPTRRPMTDRERGITTAVIY